MSKDFTIKKLLLSKKKFSNQKKSLLSKKFLLSKKVLPSKNFLLSKKNLLSKNFLLFRKIFLIILKEIVMMAGISNHTIVDFNEKELAVMLKKTLLAFFHPIMPQDL